MLGIYSCISTLKPTDEEMMETDETYMLTPPNWNPHCDYIDRNDEVMFNWTGELVEMTRVKKILMSEVPEEHDLGPAIGAITLEGREEVPNIASVYEVVKEEVTYSVLPSECNEIQSILTSVNAIYNDSYLVCQLTE